MLGTGTKTERYYQDITEEVNLYFKNIPTEQLEGTTRARRLPDKTEVPNIYTDSIEGIGKSVLEIVHQENIKDSEYQDLEIEDWLPFEVPEEELSLREVYYKKTLGQKTAYYHYQDHIYWDTCTVFKNLQYYSEEEVSKPKRYKVTRYQPWYREYQFPEQHINQPPGPFVHSIRIPVVNTTEQICSTTAPLLITRGPNIKLGWYPREEWNLWKFYPSTPSTTGVKTILKIQKIPFNTYKLTVEEPHCEVPPPKIRDILKHKDIIIDGLNTFNWLKTFWVPNFCTREAIDQVRPVHIDYDYYTEKVGDYKYASLDFPDYRPNRSSR
jgi:hypothetical protein